MPNATARSWESFTSLLKHQSEGQFLMTMEQGASALISNRNIDVAPNVWTPSSRGRSDSQYVLLTGATGFLGQYLLRELTRREIPVAVMVRPSKRQDAPSRVVEIMRRWQHDTRGVPRVSVLTGDVTRPNLGLSSSARKWVQRNCRAILHNAASVIFVPASRDREPWTTNLRGTENVLRFCVDHGIGDLHHMSTAYVCGVREGVISENELDCGQTFRNPYEASKFEAEQMVHACDRLVHKTIYRPSIITGDSQTGATCSYHGMMWYLKLFDVLIPQQPKNERGRYQTDIVLPINGDEPHDVVTVDWVAETIVRLFLNPSARDTVFHVTASQPTTIRAVVDFCCEYYNSEGVVYAGRQAGRRATSDFADLVFRMAQAYHGYEQSAPQFDRTNLLRFLPDANSPPVDRDMVIRFIEFGRQDRWGKRRRKTPPNATNAVVTPRLSIVE